VDAGVVYLYKVRAIFNDQQGAWSNTDSGYAGGGEPGLNPPFELVATDGLYADKVRLEWGYEGDYGYFEVWRKLDGEGHEWAKIRPRPTTTSQ
jgi:hypothetical protein